jgi:aldehyde dehydrogenase (NAD+)
VNHPDVDKIAFTGSTEVGKRDRRKAVAGDEQAADARTGRQERRTSSSRTRASTRRSRDHQGIYFNQGHVCCAGSRLFVQESMLTAW